MTDRLSIGIDLGSTGVRVAYPGADGELSTLPASTYLCPLLLCESTDGSPLNVSFPSLKSKLGQALELRFEGRRCTPEELVGELLKTVREAVETRIGEAIARGVLAVPACFSAVQRAALRDAALSAGFGEVDLISDSVCAVIACQEDPRDAATVLVCGIGYSGFELALVRAARGHYRPLAYEGGTEPGGEIFDRMILRALLRSCAQDGLHLDTRGWDGPHWLRARLLAEEIKEALGQRSEVVAPVKVVTTRGTVQAAVGVRREHFEEAVRPSLAELSSHIEALFKQTRLSRADIDGVLLVGGSARIPFLAAEIAGEVETEPRFCGSEDLARGAALYGARVGSRRMAGRRVAEEGTARPQRSAPEARLQAILHRPPALDAADNEEPVLEVAEAPPPPEAPKELLAGVRHLIDDDRRNEARAWLEELIAEAEQLLHTLSPTRPAPVNAGKILARRALSRARENLERGRLEEAVLESHAAWREDSASPETFEAMIDVHCQAAEASATIEGYRDALRWLVCAYQHDQGNAGLRRRVAERHFLQAEMQARLEHPGEALAALAECLQWDPEHAAAQSLQESLTKVVEG